MLSAGAAANGGLIVFPDFFTTANNELIIAAAAQNRVPAIYPYRYFAANGGLMSYGVNTAEEFRRAAGYVDRILRGAKYLVSPFCAVSVIVIGSTLHNRLMNADGLASA